MNDATEPRYELDDDLAVITLDDGRANVFSTASLRVLEGLLDRVEADRARGLVVIGRPGRFSAGFDLGEMTVSSRQTRELVARGARWWLRLYGLGIPTVGACTGHALAGGAITLLGLDVRIGADVDAKIGLNEVAIGMTLPKFAVELARDRIAASHLLRVTTGEIFDPAGAVEAGFLDRIVPEADLVDEAVTTARQLAERNTTAYGGTKRNLRGAMIERCLAELDADMGDIVIPSP